ncbi:hypothetical protein BN1708_012487 [Verticillium longisporum]|uniref:Uncharacterized protein n=1 Tax=Verticillium longisporum TaxID=100787 RepID=A0A0G4LAH0_VERLO|nr:hypothetical protein BN1708_012487 [Verticillium longisporum]
MSSPLLCAGPGRAPGERIVALNATVYEFNPFELGQRRIIFGRVAGIKSKGLACEVNYWMLPLSPNGAAALVDRHVYCIPGHELTHLVVNLRPLHCA